MTFHPDTRRHLRAGHHRVGDRWTRLPSRVWAPVGARLYDPFLSLAESRGMAARRARLLAEARGRVLEIGAGTGLNLEHYPTHVDEVVLTEPVAGMVRRLAGRAGASPLPTPITVARADRLPFPDDSFDTVVSTLVLCTVPDPTTALTELRRVLRPTGRLLFCEHVRSESPRLARWQTSLRGGWAVFAQGCRPDRRLLEMISDTFDVRSVVHDHWRAMPALVRPLVVGSAAPFPSEPARVSAERRSAHGGHGSRTDRVMNSSTGLAVATTGALTEAGGASAPAPYPGSPSTGFGEHRLELRGGPTVVVRPITPADGPRLRAYLEGLSDRSRYLRFLQATPRIGRKLIDLFTTSDPAKSLVLVATLGDEIVAEAMLAASSGAGGDAEIAVSVAERLRRRGLARAMVHLLLDAGRRSHVERVTADVSGDNRASQGLLAAFGAAVAFEDGLLVYRLTLDPVPTPEPEATRAWARVVGRR